MRKYTCFAVMAACFTSLMGTGCKNEVENYFGKSSAERINEAVAEYSQIVSSSPGGWVMEYYPTNQLTSPRGHGFLIMADIRPDGSVAMTMKSVSINIIGKDGKENVSVELGELVCDTSIWEITKDYGPVLSFSTYNNCIHTFCDPAIYETGTGFEGDYEFVIVNMEKDARHAMLKGKKRGAYVRMSRVPEGTDYGLYLDDVTHFQDSILPAKAVNYDLLTVGDSLFKVEKISSGIPNIYPYDGDAVADENWHPYLITKLDGKYHLRFRSAIGIGDIKVQEFIYDETSSQFVSVENDAVRLTGPDPVAFFADAAEKHIWNWVVSKNAMSADIYEKYAAINTEGGKLKDKYTVRSIQFSSFTRSDDTSTLSLDMMFRTSKGRTATVSYLYDMNIGSDSISLSSPQPKDATSANVLKSLPSVVPFLETVQASYMLKGSVTDFCMNDLVMRSEDGKFITVKYGN